MTKLKHSVLEVNIFSYKYTIIISTQGVGRL